MNKVAVVLGVAAVATLAGCKDPDYVGNRAPIPATDAKNISTIPAGPAPTTIEPARCMCPPGTKHTSPCTCGAPDCACVVEKPMPLPPVIPVEPEYTIYVVQSGDYLAKISKRFNVTINSIRRLNKLTKDTVRVGQKLKLPGKVDVPPAPAKAVSAAKPAKAAASAKPASKKGYVAYTGATKEYVVKNGDTLGAIAYGNGCNIRQLKELNGLTKDALKVGQKLKVPAAGTNASAKKAVAPAVATVAVAAPAPKAPVQETPAATPSVPTSPAVEPPAPVVTPAAAPVAEPAAAAAKPAAGPTYVVQEGDDITSISIAWGVSAAEIRELNKLGDDAQLKPGDMIKLPPEAAQQ